MESRTTIDETVICDITRPPWGISIGYGYNNPSDKFKMKHLIVRSGARLSLQFHKLRDEFWVVVEGVLTFLNEKNQLKEYHPGDIIYVSANTPHRICNDGDNLLVIAEIQIGDCKEEDIVRLEDDYKR